MDTYTSNSLFEISKDRCEIAISNHIDEDVIRYMVDLVGYFDKNVPNKRDISP